MEFPKLRQTTQLRDSIAAFGGYNHEETCAEAELYDSLNVTSDFYPLLSPRSKRGKVKDIGEATAMLYKNGLWWIDGNVLYKDGVQRGSFSSAQRLVGMGSRVYAFPSGRWFESLTSASGSIYLSRQNYTAVTPTGGSASATLTVLDRDGNAITNVREESYYNTHTPAAFDYCYFTVAKERVLKQYSGTQKAWLDVTDSQIQISFDGLGGFSVGDGVRVHIAMNCDTWAINPNIFTYDEEWATIDTIITKSDSDAEVIAFNGVLPAATETYTNLPILIERMMPSMKFVTECNNRLWGCSADGHEIYASKLGDGTNWNVFNGISTDSYAATVGSDGAFTAAITYGGYPHFFKENSIVKVYVSATGAHQLKETFCSGVRADSPDSLKEIDGVLIYKALSDICMYDGSYPSTIATNFGNIQYRKATAGACRHKYYISMTDDGTNYTMFCYDLKRGLWEKEDSTKATAFVTDGDELYFGADNFIWSVFGGHPYTLKTDEDSFIWSATFGKMGYRVNTKSGARTTDKKFVARITVRASLEVGSTMGMFVQYDSAGEWKNVMNLSASGTQTYTIGFLPNRCDHFTLKIVGKGNGKLLAITKTLERGSEE